MKMDSRIVATDDARQVAVRNEVEHYQVKPTSPRALMGQFSRKVRVCIVTSEQLSSNPRVVKEADALAEAGCEVRVVACQWMDWARREDAALLQDRAWRCQI